MKLTDYLGVDQELELGVLLPSVAEGVAPRALSFSSQVMVPPDAAKGLFWVMLPPAAREEVHAQLEVGKTVRVAVFHQEGPLHFTTTIKAVEYVGKDQGLCLALTETTAFEKVQRREYMRVFVNRPVTIYLVDVLTKQPDMLNPVVGRIYNLSGGGLRLGAPRWFCPGHEALLQFDLRAAEAKGGFNNKETLAKEGSSEVSSTLFSIRARVIKSDENESRLKFRDERYVTAFRFQSVSSSEQSKLMRECFRLELSCQVDEKTD